MFDNFVITLTYNRLYIRYCRDNGSQFDPSANLDSDVDIQKLSELLYLNLCEELGYESITEIRRNIYILVDKVNHQINSNKSYLLYRLGSNSEGFRITTSDSDHMAVITDNVVVNNTTEISEFACTNSNKIVITMEIQHTNPVYVRLILETDKSRTSERISRSCHNYDDKLYISSTKFGEYRMSSLEENVEAHGPCTTIN